MAEKGKRIHDLKWQISFTEQDIRKKKRKLKELKVELKELMG